MTIKKHDDDDGTFSIYAEDAHGNRDYTLPQLNVYNGFEYLRDPADAGTDVRVGVQFPGGSASVQVKRSELLEALGVSPALLNDLAQALKVHDDIDSLPRGDDEQADQVHARRGDAVALAAEALLKAVQS